MRRRGCASVQDAPPLRASLLTAAAGFGTFLVVSFLWGLRLSLTATEGPEVNPLYDLLHADTIDWGAISETLVYVFFSPGTGNWQPAFFTDGTNNFVAAVTAGLLTVGLLAAALALRSAPRVSALGIGLLVLTLLGPFLLVALNFYGNHLYYMLSPRHGYGLLPGLAACAAVLARGSRAEPGDGPAGRAVDGQRAHVSADRTFVHRLHADASSAPWLRRRRARGIVSTYASAHACGRLGRGAPPCSA